MRKLQQDNAVLARRLSTLEGSIPVLLCGRELRSLLNRVRQECNAEAAGDGDAKTCTTDKLKGAITQAKHEMQASSIGGTLLTLLRHEVLYLDDRGDRPASTRETRLSMLAGEKLAKDTRFIVVASPEHGAPAAERRAKLTIDLLTQAGIDPARIERPWIYNLQVTTNQLKPADRPGTAEPKDLNRAVFILRTEC